jgi:hypothetical protein
VSLAVAVLDCLLREDYGGLSRRVRDGALVLPGGRGLPLRPDGFLADLRIAPGAAVSLDDVDAVLDAVSDPADADGVAAFKAECRAALAAARPPVTVAGDPLGWRGALEYDALAATMPHPAYPTWAARTGFSAADSRRYGPEHRAEFSLRWAAVPRDEVVRAGGQTPDWWPSFADVGLPRALAATHDLLPVHPVTAGEAVAAVAPGGWLRVRPTLSTRTVAVLARPDVHLKLPLPASTLGLRNRRAIQPRTLADGALVCDVLRSLDVEGLLVADDRTFAHAGDPYLGYLLRRFPPGLDESRIVPVAALPAAGPLIEGGDLLKEFRGYLDLVFGVAVRLFTGYGIALESHQQNAAVVTGPEGSRLLVKDFDGTLINYPRLAAALGDAAPNATAFADPRLLTGCDDALADVFITITVHLCAGAIAFGLAARGWAPLGDLLAVTRDALRDALGAYPGDPAAALLRARVLDADRLPGKAMVTAGTLVDKSRTGASDINKYYGTSGPNYLRGLA